jgi:hypothetical protein
MPNKQNEGITHSKTPLMLAQVSISSTLNVRIFRTNVVFSSYVLDLSKKFVRKICAFNVDEIDNRPLNGLISPTFYMQILCTKIPKVQKKQSSHQCLLAFFYLCRLKLLIKHLWNWPHVTLKQKCSPTFFVGFFSIFLLLWSISFFYLPA